LSSATYAQKLLDPRWDVKRLRILKRDECVCQRCGATNETLQVHHLIYIEGREPWEYRDGDLLALCELCHEFQHEVTGSESQIARGTRATTYPNLAKSIGEVIASAIG
jgi:5-methylcytosine-specific restriction endonuclease McrA